MDIELMTRTSKLNGRVQGAWITIDRGPAQSEVPFELKCTLLVGTPCYLMASRPAGRYSRMALPRWDYLSTPIHLPRGDIYLELLVTFPHCTRINVITTIASTRSERICFRHTASLSSIQMYPRSYP